MLGCNWTAKVSSADASITEPEQIIVSRCCFWHNELLTLKAESCALLCFGWWWRWCPPYTSCHRGIYTASAGAPMEAVSILGGSASRQWDGLDVCSPSTLFSSDFCRSHMCSHSPQKHLDRFCYFEECYSEILHMVSFTV